MLKSSGCIKDWSNCSLSLSMSIGCSCSWDEAITVFSMSTKTVGGASGGTTVVVSSMYEREDDWVRISPNPLGVESTIMAEGGGGSVGFTLGVDTGVRTAMRLGKVFEMKGSTLSLRKISSKDNLPWRTI